MAVKRERGISLSSAVMRFEHEGAAFNLLDTPGHRISAHWDLKGHLWTLTALTSAVMVLDAADSYRGGADEPTRIATVEAIAYDGRNLRYGEENLGNDPFSIDEAPSLSHKLKS